MTTQVAALVENIELLTQEIQELYLSSIPMLIGYSGGKDSTATLQLIWNAIAELPVEERTTPINVITTDTKVENPIVAAWVKNSLEQMREAAKELQMPFIPNLLTPKVQDSFWVNLIGKGYAAPRNNFRWCTERLKIKPSNQFVKDKLADGEIVLALGTRKKESQTRARAMRRQARGRVKDRLSPNQSLPGSLIYSPIEDWSTEEVWIYLNQWENPWGHSNKDLFVMYRGATADNECPLVVDTSTPSCGDSRFGCWVCTMVSKDKSMEAMIQNDEEKEWMQPLLEIRDELDIEDDRDRRDFRRMSGNVQYFTRKDGTLANIPGPYLKEWREHWLRRVLEAQTQVRRTAPSHLRDITLISAEELAEIRRIWVDEKHEFDDALPRIVEEATGLPYGSDLMPAQQLCREDWLSLEKLCKSPMELEFISTLLGTKQTQADLNALEQCFKRSSRTKEEVLGLQPVPAKPTSWAAAKFEISNRQVKLKFSSVATELAKQLVDDLQILQQRWQEELDVEVDDGSGAIAQLEREIQKLESQAGQLERRNTVIVVKLEELRFYKSVGSSADGLPECEKAHKNTLDAIAKAERDKQRRERALQVRQEKRSKLQTERDNKQHYLKVLPRVLTLLEQI